MTDLIRVTRGQCMFVLGTWWKNNCKSHANLNFLQFCHVCISQDKVIFDSTASVFFFKVDSCEF